MTFDAYRVRLYVARLRLRSAVWLSIKAANMIAGETQRTIPAGQKLSQYLQAKTTKAKLAPRRG
jgi:hypothetical protein